MGGRGSCRAEDDWIVVPELVLGGPGWIGEPLAEADGCGVEWCVKVAWGLVLGYPYGRGRAVIWVWLLWWVWEVEG